MAVRKKCDISLYRSDSGNEPIDPGGNLRRAFSARAAVTEEHPARCLCTDVVRGQSLILPIVPFDEGGIDFSLRAEAGELAGPSHARSGLVRTSVNVVLARSGASCLATFRPFSVNGMSVVPVCCPLRLHSVSPCRIRNARRSNTCFSSSVARTMDERSDGGRRLIDSCYDSCAVPSAH